MELTERKPLRPPSNSSSATRLAMERNVFSSQAKLRPSGTSPWASIVAVIWLSVALVKPDIKANRNLLIICFNSAEDLTVCDQRKTSPDLRRSRALIRSPNASFTAVTKRSMSVEPSPSAVTAWRRFSKRRSSDVAESPTD